MFWASAELRCASPSKRLGSALWAGKFINDELAEVVAQDPVGDLTSQPGPVIHRVAQVEPRVDARTGHVIRRQAQSFVQPSGAGHRAIYGETDSVGAEEVGE